MTTTELIKILQDNEKGGISHKSRQISLTVNGRYLPDPQITLSSTGDGIAGPEIDFDVDGEWLEHEDDKRLKEIQEEARSSLNALMATLYNKGYQDGAKALAEHHELCRDEADGTDNIMNKIKSIVAEWKTDTWTDNFSYECMIKIAEIIDKAESEEEDWIYDGNGRPKNCPLIEVNN